MASLISSRVGSAKEHFYVAFPPAPRAHHGCTITTHWSSFHFHPLPSPKLSIPKPPPWGTLLWPGSPLTSLPGLPGLPILLGTPDNRCSQALLLTLFPKPTFSLLLSHQQRSLTYLPFQQPTYCTWHKTLNTQLSFCHPLHRKIFSGFLLSPNKHKIT